MKKAVKAYISIFLSVILFAQGASAFLDCKFIHLPESSPRVKIDDGVFKFEEPDGTFHEMAKGVVTFNERPLPENTKKALMELVYLATFNTGTKISEKLIEGKDKGRIILGFNLKNGYSVEVVYSSDYRERAVFQNPKAFLILPRGGDREAITLHEVDGSFRMDSQFELEGFPGVSAHNFQISIPPRIDGLLLKEFMANTKAFDLFSDDAKFDLRNLAASKNYTLFKFGLIKKVFLDKLKTFWVEKGFFKQTSKMVWPIFGLLTLWGAVHFFPAEVVMVKDTVVDAVTVKNYDWAKQSIDQFANRESLPTDVKSQLHEIADEIVLYKTNTSQNLTVPNKAALNLNFNGKFALNKQQYMWSETVFNPTTGTNDTILILTQDNRAGTIYSFTAKINEQKFATLIHYLKAKGQINTIDSGN